MSHLKVNELVAAAHATAPSLPPTEAELMHGLAARLDITFAALKEAMNQRTKQATKVPDEISLESEYQSPEYSAGWNDCRSAMLQGNAESVEPEAVLICDMCGHDAWHQGGSTYECTEGHVFEIRAPKVEQADYRSIVERISEIIHGKVTDIDLLTVTIKSMKDKLSGKTDND